MTVYQQDFARLAPDLNPVHVETLAYVYEDTLNGMPEAFFFQIVSIAYKMGATKLARLHYMETGQ